MTTLGSCIATCLSDRERRVGGMNHFMLPDTSGAPDNGRYGSYAMELLINQPIKRGGTRATMQAKVFGGGSVITGMNSIACRAWLPRPEVRQPVADFALGLHAPAAAVKEKASAGRSKNRSRGASAAPARRRAR